MNRRILTIYYDGSCVVCSREMDYYRGRDHDGVLDFVDITAPQFDARLHGRSQGEFMARLHVREPNGEFHTGVDAFAAIWRYVPGRHYDLLANLVQLPGIHLVANLGYEAFARVRPWLPKRSGGCEDDSCRWGHEHPRH